MQPLIVFDLDGTLVDSRLDLAESANELLDAYGVEPLPVPRIVGMVGEGARVLVERVLTAGGLDPERPGSLEEFLRIYDRRLLNNTTVYPGIEAALADTAPETTMAVLTNKPAHHTARLLDALGLTHWFGGGIIGGDTPLGRKPDPAGLASLIQKAGAAPRTTLMVGDSKVDVETAVRAGTRICLVRYGFGGADRTDVPAATPVLVSEVPEDLAACLQQFVADCARSAPIQPDGQSPT